MPTSDFMSDRQIQVLALLIRYSQTKWVAEQLVARAGKRGLPIAIYRLGEVLFTFYFHGCVYKRALLIHFCSKSQIELIPML